MGIMEPLEVTDEQIRDREGKDRAKEKVEFKKLEERAWQLYVAWNTGVGQSIDADACFDQAREFAEKAIKQGQTESIAHEARRKAYADRREQYSLSLQARWGEEK